jgi:hypothetical protein
MKHIIVSMLAIILLASVVHAAFIWENYVGSSQWDVQVSEDEGGCGGSVKTKVVEVTVTHDRIAATMGDYGHGELKGSFFGNTLTLPSRVIDDEGGKSTLAEAKVYFSPDCLSFKSTYGWHYVSQYQDCSGTTKKELLTAARAADAREQEAKYKDILTNDPTNFWANWDMAELKKKQGDYQAFLDYTAKAASNKNIEEKTATELKNTAAQSLHISEFPTRDKSPILRIEMDEMQNWNNGMIYNVNFRKPADPPSWKTVLRRIFLPNSYDVVNKAVGMPED